MAIDLNPPPKELMSPHTKPDSHHRKILKAFDDLDGEATTQEIAAYLKIKKTGGLSRTLGDIFLRRRYIRVVSGQGKQTKWQLLPEGERFVKKMVSD